MVFASKLQFLFCKKRVSIIGITYIEKISVKSCLLRIVTKRLKTFSQFLLVSIALMYKQLLLENMAVLIKTARVPSVEVTAKICFALRTLQKSLQDLPWCCSPQKAIWSPTCNKTPNYQRWWNVSIVSNLVCRQVSIQNPRSLQAEQSRIWEFD